MASGGFGKVQSYSVSTAGGSRNFSYRTLSELKDLLAYVQSRCAMERGKVPSRLETCIRQSVGVVYDYLYSM